MKSESINIDRTSSAARSVNFGFSGIKREQI